MNSPSEPRAEYAKRLRDRQETVDRRRRQDWWIGNLRLLTFLGILVALGLAWARTWPWELVPVLAVLFVVLLVVHARVLNRREEAEAAVRFYEAGLRRLDGQWAGTGCSGEAYIPEDHLYAGDLDLFGRGALYERMCLARTPSGEKTLAQWFCEPATPATIAQRQAAVEELRERLDLREDLARYGAAAGESVRPEHLAAWADGNPVLRGSGLRVTAIVLTAASVAAAGFSLATGNYAPLLLIALVDFAVYGAALGRVLRVGAEADKPCSQLTVLARVLGRFEAEEVRSPMLRDLRATLLEGSESASARIRRLDRIMRLFEWQRNQVFLPFAILLLWGIHFGYALENWRARWGNRTAHWLAAVGQLEALCSLACYAYENPQHVFPTVEEGPARFQAVGLGHPLLPDGGRVANDVQLDEDQRLLVISGSNMSGKSTLLRTVGINAVLAQMGAPVTARKLALSPLQLGATIRVQDSIQQGKSRFYAEIARLEKMMERAEAGIPLLFLLDEIMHGTNSHDRRIGSEAILRAFLAKGAIGLITTHDLALTAVADELGAPVRNVHFTDEFRDGQLVFDYKLRDGVVEASNALELMRSLGLPV